jgi:hypothetical protein
MDIRQKWEKLSSEVKNEVKDSLGDIDTMLGNLFCRLFI